MYTDRLMHPIPNTKVIPILNSIPISGSGATIIAAILEHKDTAPPANNRPVKNPCINQNIPRKIFFVVFTCITSSPCL